MKKVLTVAFAFLILANIGFAQAKKPAAPKTAPITVIVMEDSQFGGRDQALDMGLERFFGVPLEITTITRAEALGNEKFAGLNLDFMPLYLVHRNALTDEKLGEPVKMGQLKANKDFIILEKQTRHGVFAGNARKPNTLEVFVMSQCPYGAMAENKIIEAQKLGRIPKDIKVDVRYIVSMMPDGSFRSLHGSPEWEENVRQLIIKDKYPNKFWKYLEIRNRDYQSSLWDVAAEEAGINPAIFRKQWKRGLELLKKEAEYSSKVGISGSPTFLWEGRVLTDMGGLAVIPGLAGIVQSEGGRPAPSAPAGQC